MSVPDKYYCPTCGTNCYTARVLAKHLKSTSCSPRYDPLNKLPTKWSWEEDPAPVLTFVGLVDRLADIFHESQEERPGFIPRARLNTVTTVAKVTGLGSKKVRDILVNRTAPDVTCLEADSIMRALSIDLRAIINPQDINLGLTWQDRRTALLVQGATIDHALTDMIENLNTMTKSNKLTVIGLDNLVSEVGVISAALDAVRIILQAKWNRKKQLPKIRPKSKAEYRREIHKELSRMK